MKKGEKFEKLMIERGYNRNTLSKASGVPYSTIDSMIERDFHRASIDSVISLANVLGVKVEEFIPEAAPKKKWDLFYHDNGMSLVEVKTPPRNKDDYFEVIEKAARDAKLKQVDFYGQISAGDRDNTFIKECAEPIELPKILLGKYANRSDIFVMKASGNSMNKIIPDGSFVICIPVEAHDLHHNDIVIYSYENELSMKRYRTVGDNVAFTPESTHDNYFDFVVSRNTINTVKIIAKVISYHVILE